MALEVAMIARHSPRVRAEQTAKLFMQGFEEVARSQGVKISRVRGPSGNVKLVKRGQLEAHTTASEAADRPKLPADKKRQQEEAAKVERGEASRYLLPREVMLEPGRMGYLLTHSRIMSKLAKRLGEKAGSRRVRRVVVIRRVPVVATRRVRRIVRYEKAEPTVVSIFLRHSLNDGDKLTPDGEKLARQQGRRLAKHLLDNFFTQGKSRVRPTIILNVSHGGFEGVTGALDWVKESVLGNKVSAFGGQVKQAEGLVTLGYSNGHLKRLYLRQYGVTHLH